MIQISKEQFMQLEKLKFFAEFKNQNGYYPFAHSNRKYYVEDTLEMRKAIQEKLNNRSDQFAKAGV